MTEMTPLSTIEAQALAYRQARDRLQSLVAALEADIQSLKLARMPRLREALATLADTESRLRADVGASPAELWQKPRTRTFHGVKVGYAKQRGRVEFDDEAKVIERMRRLLPKDQAELLVRVREAVHKPAVYDLTAADLRRLGITVTADCDQIVVQDVAGELDRAIDALLADLRDLEEAA